jgi:hypothetical protein
MLVRYLLVFLLFSLFSCRKEATSWFTDWQVPLINDTLDLKNLTNDSTFSIQNGFYQLNFKRRIASLSPSELIKVPDTLIKQKFAIALPALSIPPGTSFVNDNKDHIFNFNDAKLKKARIKSGKIKLEVFNPIATKTIFEIELPSVTLNNKSLKENVTLDAGTRSNPSNKTIELDLSGYWIQMTGSNGVSSNALQSRLKVMTDPNGASVNLTNLDSTEFKINIQNLQFDYAQGYFGQYSFSDVFNFSSKFLKNNVTGSLDLPSIQLKFNIENSIKVPSTATIFEVKNYNSKTNKTVNLSHPQIGNPFIIENPIGSWNTLIPYKKTLEFDELNSNLENFLENLGEETSLSYNLMINPWGNISGGWDEFFPTSKLDVYTEINMPLNIGMYDLVLSDTFNVSFNQNDNKTSIESGKLIFKIENGFPFEGEMGLLFLNENSELIKSYEDKNIIFSSKTGVLNSENVQTKHSQIEFNLPNEVLSQLNSIKKIIVKIKLNSINDTSLMNEMVNIPANAFVWIKVQSAFKLKNVID